MYKTEVQKECGMLKLIDSSCAGEPKLKIYSEAERIFDYLTQNKGSDYICSAQFQRLYKLIGPQNQQQLTKANLDLLFKNICKRAEAQAMDLNSFFEAIEEICIRLNSTGSGGQTQADKKNLRAHLNEFVSCMMTHLIN